MSANFNQINSVQPSYPHSQANTQAVEQQQVQLHRENAAALQKQLNKLPAIGEDYLDKKISEINEALRPYSRYIEREMHDITHSIMYRLKNTSTNEVIDEFPPSKIQDLVAKIWERVGLFVDEKA